MDGGTELGPIASRATAVLSSFRSLVNALAGNDEGTPQIMLDNEAVRFRMWASNLDAHQSGQVSLDHQLRDAPHLQKQALYLLDDLNDSLRDAIAIASNKDPPSLLSADRGDDDENDSSSLSSFSDIEVSPTARMPTVCADIREAIDCLLRLYVAMANPTPRERFCRLGGGVESNEDFDRRHSCSGHNFSVAEDLKLHIHSDHLPNATQDRLNVAALGKIAALHAPPPAENEASLEDDGSEAGNVSKDNDSSDEVQEPDNALSVACDICGFQPTDDTKWEKHQEVDHSIYNCAFPGCKYQDNPENLMWHLIQKDHWKMNELDNEPNSEYCEFCSYRAVDNSAHVEATSFLDENRPGLGQQRKEKRPFLVTFERNSAFTGRQPEMEKLRLEMTPRQQTKKIAITGLGGIGKTQLALEFVFQQHQASPDCAVLWVPSISQETIEQGLRKAARELGIPGHDDSKANIQECLRDYLSSAESGMWILVFDNVDDINLWEERGLIHCLPRSELGTIVFTTRNKQVAVRLAGPHVIDISTMDEDTNRRLLHNHLIRKDLLDCQEDTKMLLDQLASLPLALVQAAAYINMNDITIRDYIGLLGEQEHDVVELLSENFDDASRYDNIQNPVATTWLISFTQIQQCNSLATDYLSFIACVDHKDIPRPLLPAGPSRKAEMDAIGTLKTYSFISQQASSNMFTMHRLVHIATRNWLRKNKTLAAWTDQTIEKLAKTLQEADVQDRSVWRSYMPHAYYELKLHAGLVKYKSPLFNLQWGYQQCLDYDGRYDEAEQVQLELFELTKESLDPDTLASMANLASTYMNQGRWDKAEELDVQVMEMSKTKLGPDHPDTLTSMANLASTYRNQGRWDKAEELDVQVMETRKTKLGPDHPDTLTSMANLASTFWNQGRWDKAEELDVQVMEMSKTKLGPDHPDTLTSMANLASTYRNQGRWDKAEELDVQVMEMSKTKLGPDHPDTLTSMANLASTYRNQGRWDKAEELDVQVMEMSKTKLGPDHPDTLTSMANLASTYRNQGRWDKAEELDV